MIFPKTSNKPHHLFPQRNGQYPGDFSSPSSTDQWSNGGSTRLRSGSMSSGMNQMSQRNSLNRLQDMQQFRQMGGIDPRQQQQQQQHRVAASVFDLSGGGHQSMRRPPSFDSHHSGQMQQVRIILTL